MDYSQDELDALVKAVLRFKDGGLLKGYLVDFTDQTLTVGFVERGMQGSRDVPIEELKAIFFVRSFDGDRQYNEHKLFGRAKGRGKKILVKFKDKETLVGFLEKDSPRYMDFHLTKNDPKTGLFVWPVDEESNNLKVYVFKSAVDDIMPLG